MYEKILANREEIKTTLMERSNAGNHKSQKSSKQKLSDEERKERYYYNQLRKRNELFELIKINFKNNSSCFITLTLDNEIDVVKAGKKFENFRKNMMRAYEKFMFVATIEFTKKQGIHYHVICNISKLEDAIESAHHYWGNYDLDFKLVYNKVGLADYITKSFTKQDETSPLFGICPFKKSKKLIKPLVIKSSEFSESEYRAIKNMMITDESSKSNTVYNEKAGKIEYNTYNTSESVKEFFGDYVLARRKKQQF